MLPPRRRTWPIVLGVALLLVALPACLFSVAWSWNVAIPGGHNAHRLAIEHGKLVVQKVTYNTPPPSTAPDWKVRFDPGVSIQYAHMYRAPRPWGRSWQSTHYPFSVFVAIAAFASIGFAYYHKKQPPGHCPECGYDLAGSTDQCPECGHAAT